MSIIHVKRACEIAVRDVFVCADARREGEQSASGGPGGQRARAEDGRVRRASARGQQHQQVRLSLSHSLTHTPHTHSHSLTHTHTHSLSLLCSSSLLCLLCSNCSGRCLALEATARPRLRVCSRASVPSSSCVRAFVVSFSPPLGSAHFFAHPSDQW